MEDRNQIAYRRFATYPERGTDIPTPELCQTPPREALRRIERIEHLYPVPGKQKDAQFAPTEPRAHALGPKGAFRELLGTKRLVKQASKPPLGTAASEPFRSFAVRREFLLGRGPVPL